MHAPGIAAALHSAYLRAVFTVNTALSMQAPCASSTLEVSDRESLVSREGWRELEQLLDEGLMRSIGVYTSKLDMLQRLLQECQVRLCPPAVKGRAARHAWVPAPLCSLRSSLWQLRADLQQVTSLILLLDASGSTAVSKTRAGLAG